MSLQFFPIMPHVVAPALIPGATGTAITDGNSTWALPGNAFDGNLSQTQANAAAAASNGVAPTGFSNWVGKDWGSGVTKTITKFTATSPTNSDFLGGGVSNPTGWRFYGSNTNNTTSLAAWTLLDSGTTPGAASSDSFTRTSSTINTSQSFRYHILVLQGNGSNGVCICELQLYENL